MRKTKKYMRVEFSKEKETMKKIPEMSKMRN